MSKAVGVLGTLNAVVLSAISIVFISYYYDAAITGKVMPWIVLGGAVLCSLLVIFCIIIITEFEEFYDDPTLFGIIGAVVGGVLCVPGAICTVAVSELFWIMTGIGMALMFIAVIVDMAISKVGFIRIISACALTISLPIIILGGTMWFVDGASTRSGLYEHGMYAGYSLTKRLWKEEDADEMAFTGYSGRGLRYLTIATEVEGKPVTGISKCSFRSFGRLNGITIPSSIKIIGPKAFKKCSALKNVVYLGTATQWCQISFADKYSNPTYYTHDLFVYDGLLVNAILDDGLEKISSYAFYDCDGIKNAYIPQTVSEIGAYAFYGCDGLESISYGGTCDEWRAVQKGDEWNVGTQAHIVQCSDGKVSA